MKQKIKDERIRITFSDEVKRWLKNERKKLGLKSEADVVETLVVRARQQALSAQ